MINITKIMSEMIDYYQGDARRINHFLKVYTYAKLIGTKEIKEELSMDILEVAAVTHDIGIKNSERKYNSSAGNYQQIEGPPVAKKMLEKFDLDADFIKRVCWLIAHHHTYKGIDSLDYQILIEADFIVNAYEDNLSLKAIKSFKDKVFKTETGKTILDKLYWMETKESNKKG